MCYEDGEEFNPMDYIEEYEIEIRDILKKAVSSKIESTIDLLVETTEQNNNLEQINKELTSKLRDIERIHKQEMTLALKEKAKEIEQKFALGIAVNDIVWYAKANRTQTKCEQCDGNGKVEVEVLGKLTKVNCPHCSYGKIEHYHYSPERDQVGSIKFWISRKERGNRSSEVILKENWDIEIWLDNYDNHKSRSSLFKTKEECQIECDKGNNKGK